MLMKTLSCPECETLFEKGEKLIKYALKKNKDRKFFCSPDCFNDSRKVFVEGVCLGCGDAFRRRKSGHADKALYCGRTCSAKHISSMRRKPCGDCREPREVNSKFCGAHKRRSGNPIGDRTLVSLRVEYSLSAYHAKIRGNSRQVYKNSGREHSCHICGYSAHVDICHIKDVKDFDATSTINEVNNIDNLVALCKNHHWEFDNGLLAI